MHPPPDSPIFIVGPTAVGKSSVAVELALQIEGEIISADSMQVYRGMDIGTAKLSPPERRGVPHHLLDGREVTETWDVAQFRRLALEAIGRIRARRRRAIIVGGSGMYVRALTQGLFQGPGRDPQLRAELEQMETAELRRRLQDCDRFAAEKIKPNDRRRTIRALECFRLTGRPISELQTQWKPSTAAGDAFHLVGLDRPRPELYARCNRRVEAMFAQGLVDEVRALFKQGLNPRSPAGRAIGYAEVMLHLKDELPIAKAIEATKQRTRQFAKRQVTWFRREPGIKWLAISGDESVATTTQRILKTIIEPPAP